MTRRGPQPGTAPSRDRSPWAVGGCRSGVPGSVRSTEKTPLVRGLLVGLRDRGLDVSRPILAVVDGAKALAAAVKEVFDHAVIGRCQLHKVRNVQDHLPEKLRGLVGKRMRLAYHAPSALEAQAQLEVLVAELDKTHPGAAGSLREGM